MKFFSKVKEITSKAGELHFQRFAIFQCSIFSIYIHKILKEDRDQHLHSHPWNFWTMVLRGGYIEAFLGKDLFGKSQEFYRVKGKFSIGKADKNYFHKILYIDDGPVYTLFLTWGRKSEWYYMVGDKKIESNEYRRLKNSIDSDKKII